MGSPESENGRRANEGPQHEVFITRPFYLGMYEVTQGQYEKVTGKNPSGYTKDKGGGPRHPVETVSWEDAVAFCQALSGREAEKQRGRVYRLPTEAEWEYACRAGSRTAFSFGDDATQLGRYAWLKDNDEGRTHPVGEREPNPWGLYDMHGNAWEWCADAYDGAYYQAAPAHDPPGPRRGTGRVIRGGGIGWDWTQLRSANRYPDYSQPDKNVGFRVACDLGGQGAANTR
jgi:formylglycine-generating enzyme required for sulfatase activity